MSISRAKSGRRGSAQHDRAGARPLLLFVLVALLVQAIAVQAHLHFAQQAHALAAAASERPLHLSGPAGKDASTDCRLCQEAALGGSYLLPPAADLPPPVPAAPWIALAAMPAFALGTPALGWHSRAPPEQLSTAA